jgi:hypothetical protein
VRLEDEDLCFGEKCAYQIASLVVPCLRLKSIHLCVVVDGCQVEVPVVGLVPLLASKAAVNAVHAIVEVHDVGFRAVEAIGRVRIVFTFETPHEFESLDCGVPDDQGSIALNTDDNGHVQWIV